MRVYWRKKETFGTRFLCAFFFVKLSFGIFRSFSFMYFTIIQIQQERREKRGVIMGRLSEKLAKVFRLELFI